MIVVETQIKLSLTFASVPTIFNKYVSRQRDNKKARLLEN